MDILLKKADLMFPEGVGAPRAFVKDGGAVEKTNQLLENATKAIENLWEERGYNPKKPDNIMAKLGYRLDKYEAAAYLVTGALGLPLLSQQEAAFIGKRIKNIIGASGTVGSKLRALRKRGQSTIPQCEALLRATATLSFLPQPCPPALSSVAVPPLQPPATPPLARQEPPPCASPPPAQPVEPTPPAVKPPPVDERPHSDHAAAAMALTMMYRGKYRGGAMFNAMFFAAEIEVLNLDEPDPHKLAELTQEYEAATTQLRQQGVGMCCDAFVTGECRHGTRCFCGWVRAPWPWTHFRPGGVFCDCHRDVREKCLAILGYTIQYGDTAQLWPNCGPFRGIVPMSYYEE